MKKFVIGIICIFLIVFFFNINKKRTDNTIKFSSWGSQSEIQILKEVISDFEKEANINVDFIHIPENYFQKLQLQFASGLASDVVFINNQNIKMYIEANLLEDLTPYFEADSEEYYKSAIDSFKVDEKIYAIPRDISNLVLYVNKDILKEKSIKYTKKINTLNELNNTLAKLKSKNYFAINSENNPLYWTYFLAANGGGILSDNTKEIIINKKESIDAINLYADYINKYNFAPTKSQIGSKTTAQMFINGELAMYLGGRWMVPKFRETITFDWDIIEFPSSLKNKVYIDSSGWAIYKKSKKKEQAIKFIQYISSEEINRKLSQTGLIIPARKRIAEDLMSYDSTKKPKNSRIFIDMLKYTKPTPICKNNNMINDILKEKTESIFYGNKKAQDVFDESTIKKLKGLK